jgi:hypothetical protein
VAQKTQIIITSIHDKGNQVSTETNTIIVPELEAEAKRLSIPQDIASGIVASFAPHMQRFTEATADISTIEHNMPKSAREMRLNLVKVRTAAEKTKVSLKSDYLLRGKAIDGMYALIALKCKETETKLEAIEKAEERRLAEEKEKLRQKRATALAEFVDDVSIYPVAEMTENQFSQLLAGQSLAHQAKLAAMRKAEEDRIASEKAAAEAEEKRKEEARLAEIKRQEELEKERARLAAEAAEQRKQREAAEAQAKADRLLREQAEAKAKAEREESEKKRRELQAKIDAQAKTDRLAKEAEAKKIADAKAAEEKRLADEREAARKAAAAPDREKIFSFILAMKNLEHPKFSTETANEIFNESMDEIFSLLDGLRAKANKL